jgi:hypothetical protein
MGWVLLMIAGALLVSLLAMVLLLIWAFPRWGEGWRAGSSVPISFRCPACHRHVPDSAKQCPNCGCPFDG